MGAGTKAAVVQPRPKKLYREKEERPAVGIKASAKNAASAKQAEAVSRNALQKTAASAGLSALGRAVPLAQLTRKELQARAIKAGLKANAKSADLVKALESFAASAAAGAALLQQPVKGLNFKVDAERAEVRAQRPDARVVPPVAPACATVRLAWADTRVCARSHSSPSWLRSASAAKRLEAQGGAKRRTRTTCAQLTRHHHQQVAPPRSSQTSRSELRAIDRISRPAAAAAHRRPDRGWLVERSALDSALFVSSTFRPSFL